MKFKQYIKFVTLCYCLLALCANQGFAQIGYDGSPLFEAQTRWLADNVAKETKSEFDLRTKGFVAYADSKPIEVGDIQSFYAYDLVRNTKIKIKAKLRKIGKHCYAYVEVGRNVSAANIDKIVSNFDNKVYPYDRAMFGTEWSPGIDGDKRITLLMMDIRDNYNPSRGNRGFTAGYFYAGDEYSRRKSPGSNEREMLYLDIYPGKAGDINFLSTMAHEFQHMIHWNHDPKEYTWVNESLSQLAPYLCGYGHPNQVYSFIKNSDNNMCAWSNETMIANYGQVYLWAYYLSTHVGTTDKAHKEFIRTMVDQKSHGMSGLTAAIKKQKIKNTAPKLFRSFCVANYLNDSSTDRGIYGYDKGLAKLAIKPTIKVSSTLEGRGTVKCWSSVAANIPVTQLKGHNVRVAFSGAKQTAGRYSNKFDVAAIFYNSKKSVKPTVEWLRIRKYKASQILKEKIGKRDRMMLVIVNQGPATMKVEEAFAKNAPPAKFGFKVSATNGDARVYSANTLAKKSATNKKTRKSKSKTIRKKKKRASRAMARSVLVELASMPDLSKDVNNSLEATEQSDKLAAEVTMEFNWQAAVEKEDEIISWIKEEVVDDDFSIFEEFVDFYKKADSDTKEKFHSMKNRVVDVLKFEALQGNAKAQTILNESGLE